MNNKPGYTCTVGVEHKDSQYVPSVTSEVDKPAVRTTHTQGET